MSRHKSRKTEVRRAKAEKASEQRKVLDRVMEDNPVASALGELFSRFDAQENEATRLLRHLHKITGAQVYADALADLEARGYGGPDWKEAIDADLGVWADPQLGIALERMDALIAEGQSERGAAEIVAVQFGAFRQNTSLASLADYLRTAYRQNPGPDRWPGRHKATPGMDPPGRLVADEKVRRLLKNYAAALGMDLAEEVGKSLTHAGEEFPKAGVPIDEPVVIKVKR